MPFALIAARIQPFEFPTYNPPQWADELVSTTRRIPTMQSLRTLFEPYFF